jgi:hypothetical protein
MCKESFRTLDFLPEPRYDKGMKNETALTAYTLAVAVAAELLTLEGGGGWDEEDLEDGVFVLGFIEDQGALEEWEEYAAEGNVTAALDLALSL